ncbi:hypothetical protein PRIPAC_72153, partial [Pristionchus pacificus]|uniref:Uncharacterized protein n=1 Tax=Pristionchus pacificus TaxID=54126 RepID=A0A2A6CFL8_PRIPA
MIDIRISAAIVSGYILLVLATPYRWFHHGWRELGYPSLKIQDIVEEEMKPFQINKLIKILTLVMVLHGFWVNVLHPLVVRLREREQMGRERVWRDDQLRRIAAIQRQERNREDMRERKQRQKREENRESTAMPRAAHPMYEMRRQFIDTLRLAREVAVGVPAASFSVALAVLLLIVLSAFFYYLVFTRISRLLRPRHSDAAFRGPGHQLPVVRGILVHHCRVALVILLLVLLVTFVYYQVFTYLFRDHAERQRNFVATIRRQAPVLALGQALSEAMALSEGEMSAHSNLSFFEVDTSDGADGPNETLIAMAGIICAFLMLAVVFFIIIVLGAYCTQPLSPQQLYVLQQKREARRRPYRHCRHSHRRSASQRITTPYASPLSSRRMEQGQTRPGRREDVEEAETA